MKRIWAAIAIFAVVLGLCVWGLVSMTVTADTVLRQVEQIETAIQKEDYPMAIRLTEQTAERWDTSGRVLCGFLSHAQLETMDKELASLRVYLDAQESGRAMEHCAQLRTFWKHMQKTDLPLWENIL